MRVADSRGRGISDLNRWRSLVFDGTSKAGHWKKGLTAYSPAEFIMDPGKGASHLEERMSSVLSRRVSLDPATPEYLAKFDSYPGKPSNLDLGITGRVVPPAVGESLFMGVEAKVDERFGCTVGNTYLSAVKTRREGKKTDVPECIRRLLSRYFGDDASSDSSMFADIRYQLLTGSAGTIAVPHKAMSRCSKSWFSEVRHTVNKRVSEKC